MAKAKEGEFQIQTENFTFDLVKIRNDSTELGVLNELYKIVLNEGKFKERKPDEFCFCTAAALIMYIDSLGFIHELKKEPDESIH